MLVTKSGPLRTTVQKKAGYLGSGKEDFLNTHFIIEMKMKASCLAAREYDTGGRLDYAPTRMSASMGVAWNEFVDPRGSLIPCGFGRGCRRRGIHRRLVIQ